MGSRKVPIPSLGKEGHSKEECRNGKNKSKNKRGIRDKIATRGIKEGGGQYLNPVTPGKGQRKH